MKVRFQADADLNEIIIRAVLRREPGIDFQSAVAARLPGRLIPKSWRSRQRQEWMNRIYSLPL
jgi:hypothetical protein